MLQRRPGCVTMGANLNGVGPPVGSGSPAGEDRVGTATDSRTDGQVTLAAPRSRLVDEGFCIVPGLLPADLLARLRVVTDRMLDAYTRRAEATFGGAREHSRHGAPGPGVFGVDRPAATLAALGGLGLHGRAIGAATSSPRNPTPRRSTGTRTGRSGMTRPAQNGAPSTVPDVVPGGHPAGERLPAAAAALPSPP